ncbi:MAG: hypothetical protein JW841_01950 [Deltaproteobacteria bacterium]|nr:hypothetical protein [Deltaproteobacteria bacterium]
MNSPKNAYALYMIWFFLVLALGAIAVWSRYKNIMWAHFFTKPATISIIITATLIYPSYLNTFAHKIFITGLLLSLAGDIVLMMPRRNLILGLILFLFAHFVYIAAFTYDTAWRWLHLCWFLIPVCIAILFLQRLWSHLSSTFKIAISIYSLALAMVSWRLLIRYDQIAILGFMPWLLGVMGALAFMLADGLLAIRHFAHAKPPYALELGSYFSAQLFIAASTWQFSF